MTQSLDRTGIQALIPHREPILLLDEVTDWESDKWLEAKHHFGADNPHFTGHFPGNPLLPGVLIIEAMAQSAAVLVSLSKGLNSTNAYYLFTGIDEAQFKAQLLPGETLTMHVEKMREKLSIFRFQGKAYVNGNLAASAVFSAKLVRK